MAVCRTCKAPIEWVVTATGKRMPIDADPHDAGTIRVQLEADRSLTGHVLTGGPLEDARDRREPLYRSHFATCRDAAAHRKPR